MVSTLHLARLLPVIMLERHCRGRWGETLVLSCALLHLALHAVRASCMVNGLVLGGLLAPGIVSQLLL